MAVGEPTVGAERDVLAASVADPRVVYAVLLRMRSRRTGTISTFHDGGRNWENTPLALPMSTDARIPAVLSLAVDGSGAVYAGTDGQGVYKLTDRGTTMMALGEALYGARVDQILIGRKYAATVSVTSKGLFASADAVELVENHHVPEHASLWRGTKRSAGHVRRHRIDGGVQETEAGTPGSLSARVGAAPRGPFDRKGTRSR